MNIAVIGVGGVGGYFGSKLTLTKKKEDSVYFIARGEHLKEIREHGLCVKCNGEKEMICEPTMATENISDLPMLDVCLLCVKAYDLQSVLEQLKDKIQETTQIVPLLNGVDIYDRVRRVIKKGYVYPACVYIGTHIEKPGVINQSGGQCKIIFGKDLNYPESEADVVRDCFERAAINYEWTKDYLKEIWMKYMCISAYALVTAAFEKTMGEVYSDPELSIKLKKIMQVIDEIAEKKEIGLPEDAVNLSYEKANDFPFETKTSFQRDYEKKRGKDERETLGKTIIELAEQYQINSDCVQEIYNKLD